MQEITRSGEQIVAATAITAPAQPQPTVVSPSQATVRVRKPKSWLEERLGLDGLMEKYGRKAFPVHTTFFLGEMSLFSFVILGVTGIYLGLLYIPSNAEIAIGDQKLPQAYASVQFIESLPVANIFRNVHHWSAHLMLASIILHSLRILFFGTYRKPRELNWVIGVVLFALTLAAAFLGYSLPYDSFSLTATGVGYGIAKSVPYIGNIAADLTFGGTYPTLGSIPRLYTLHIFVIPLLLAGGIAAHMAILVKQKHTQPGYAKRLAEPGKVLGVPLAPYQAILGIQLLLLMFGTLFLLSAFIPVHPLSAYGPPGAGSSSDVKPDWYLLWVYGFLKMLPSFDFHVLGGQFNQEFVGGLVFPGAIFGLYTFAPWLDRTNRRVLNRYYEYLEPPRQGPLRMAVGLAVLAFIGVTFLAAYKEQLNLSLLELWLLAIAVPGIVGAAVYFGAKSGARNRTYFDPTGEDAHEVVPGAVVPAEPMYVLND